MPFPLYLLALAVFVMGTSEFMLAGLAPDMAADLDVTIGAAGLLTSAFAVGMVVGAPLMAAFARRWPPRLTLLACLVAFAGCHVLGALTSAFPVLLTTRALSAVATAGFLAVALSTATALVAPDRKGRALSILLSGTTVAVVAGVPAGALLGEALGWRATFWTLALLCVPAALGVAVGIPNQRRATSDDTPSLRAELGVLASPPLVLAMLLGALINGGTFAVLTFLAPIVTGTAGLAAAWVPVVLVLFGVGSFLGVVIAGRLSDTRSALVLSIGGPLLLVGWVVLALVAAHPVLLFALVLVQGVLAFGVGSTVITRVLYAASDAPTMGGSYATAALNVGAAIGPMLGALALSGGRAATAPVWVAGMLVAIAVAVMSATSRTSARVAPPRVR
ncbi:MFS transporter [Microbacterium sp. M28]|uniref:Cmx/CmrA family chloramphenicol efflux MFS transporter n=1 Tax=Microbacterium sp. M28 TaxID=2962064 RepID=UPI0021F44009|nr:Cmx/CmrA family chloramphenicol efflux MFS transporter [Microbacterium sp. M28]UYO96230.1 MFS transporter [Microbacterium sp. M28]